MVEEAPQAISAKNMRPGALINVEDCRLAILLAITDFLSLQSSSEHGEYHHSHKQAGLWTETRADLIPFRTQGYLGKFKHWIESLQKSALIVCGRSSIVIWADCSSLTDGIVQ